MIHRKNNIPPVTITKTIELEHNPIENQWEKRPQKLTRPKRSHTTAWENLFWLTLIMGLYAYYFPHNQKLNQRIISRTSHFDSNSPMDFHRYLSSSQKPQDLPKRSLASIPMNGIKSKNIIRSPSHSNMVLIATGNTLFYQSRCHSGEAVYCYFLAQLFKAKNYKQKYLNQLKFVCSRPHWDKDYSALACSEWSKNIINNDTNQNENNLLKSRLYLTRCPMRFDPNSLIKKPH